MSDWMGLIVAVLGSTTFVTILNMIFFRRENKHMKAAEVNTKNAEVLKAEALARRDDASAAKEMLEVMVDVKKFLLGLNDTLKTTIADRESLIVEKDDKIDSLLRLIKELQYTISIQDRKIKGMLKVIENNLNILKDRSREMTQEEWEQCKQYLKSDNNELND